jgi:hypothetical protein
MTCQWCASGFPLHARLGVMLHVLMPAPQGGAVCEDEQPPHYASHYARSQKVEPRLVEIRSYPYSGPYDQAMVEFHFADGSIKRLTDPDEIDEMRRRYRVKEGRTGHGF